MGTGGVLDMKFDENLISFTLTHGIKGQATTKYVSQQVNHKDISRKQVNREIL